MKIVVLARSPEYKKRFLDLHEGLHQFLDVRLGVTSYFQLLNEVIGDSAIDYACVVHDDVILSKEFFKSLVALVGELESDWNNWGIVGNAGVATLKFGFNATNVIRYLFDPHGGPNLVGLTVPVYGIDGNVMLINARGLRDGGVKLPSFEGFQLYDIILSLETLRAGLSVLVSPKLACFHKSSGNQLNFNAALRSSALAKYLSSILNVKYLDTLNGRIEVDRTSDEECIKFNPLTRAMSVCYELERVKKNVAIVIRTQFKRRFFLNRCIDSIKYFLSNSVSVVEFSTYIATDQDVDFDYYRGLKILKLKDWPGGDSRFVLVRHAIQSICSDFMWFVDDDDWLFPQTFRGVADAVIVGHDSSLIFCDVQHFHESGNLADDLNGKMPQCRPGRRFFARDFLRSLSGHNFSPFSSVIFSRKILSNIPVDVFDRITYYEDYFMVLHALHYPGVLPIVVEELVVGISHRDYGNTISVTDRSVWDKSLAELSFSFLRDSYYSQLISLNQKAASNDASPALVDSARVDALLNSWSWRLTAPLRWVYEKLSGLFSTTL